MSYMPPTSSKYAPVSLPVPLSPFEQKRAVPTHMDRQSVDWKAFGGNKKDAANMPSAPAVKTFTPIQPRNQLATYIDLAAPSINAEEEKWQQSAIRRRPVPSAAASAAATPKTYEDLFPTLGAKDVRPVTPVVKPSPDDLGKGQGQGLSMAERMRIKLAEEEEERQRQHEQSERERLVKEEEDRQTRMFGFMRAVNLSKKTQIFEDEDDIPMHEGGDAIETDVYGFRVGDDDSYLPTDAEEGEDETW